MPKVASTPVTELKMETKPKAVEPTKEEVKAPKEEVKVVTEKKIQEAP